MMKKFWGGDRLWHIDVLKGIGIILMVMGHMPYCTTGFQKYVFGFHMPLFFGISGYLYQRPDSLKAYVVRKIRTLIVPYFAFGLGYCALAWILSGTSALLKGIRRIHYLQGIRHIKTEKHLQQDTSQVKKIQTIPVYPSYGT